jgi:hypothetical protein
VCIWPDGRRYDGSWKNGKQDGEGQYTSEDGITITGLWKDGIQIKPYASNQAENPKEEENSSVN